ncbi:heterokaryon incompatibility protein-domain-containing protein [Nemania sp. FL0916]|nr:heterokaryon incompatibility protein-domain-containing protein [Nemania sp. FL0916]
MTNTRQSEDFQSLAYDPLQDGEIRLLKLNQTENAVENDSIIECTIAHHSLHEGPVFSALSYVWGNDEAVVPITLNGKATKVRPNLASFLRQAQLQQDPPAADSALDAQHITKHVRQADTARARFEPFVTRPNISSAASPPQVKNTPVEYIWIDALCIDQSNVPERTAQVAMMRDIYAKSSRIIIWLGTAADRSDRAMDMLKSGEKKGILRERTSLAALMQRPYWTRAWTQQEASTPDVPCEVWCGTKRLTYEEFRQMDDVFQEFHRRDNYGPRTNHAEEELPHPALGKIDSTKELRSTRDTRVAYNRSNTYTRHYRTEQAAQFGNLLVKYMHLEATDMRDRVYALLPVYQDLEQSHGYPVEVDYTVAAGEVFRRAMAWALAFEKDYHLLMFCSAGSRAGAESWVVGFSKPPVMTPRFEDRMFYGKFGAGYWDLVRGDFRLLDGLSGAQQRLSVTGAEIARITDTYGPPLRTYNWLAPGGGVDVEQVAVWLEGAARFAFPDKIDTPYVRGGSTVAAMDGILSTGLSAILRKTTWPYLDLIAGKGASCLPGSRDGAWSDIRCENGVLFRTDDGHLGAGDSALQTGDVVVVILGIRLPMILRPVGDMWEIIGSCFVSGRMEWWDNSKMWEKDGEQKVFLIC